MQTEIWRLDALRQLPVAVRHVAYGGANERHRKLGLCDVLHVVLNCLSNSTSPLGLHFHVSAFSGEPRSSAFVWRFHQENSCKRISSRESICGVPQPGHLRDLCFPSPVCNGPVWRPLLDTSISAVRFVVVRGEHHMGQRLRPQRGRPAQRAV